ncbi:MAG: hypothetical protein U5K72_02420 [Balneolaceae bacterium]|nr:hypothetical protein [Balneolaceae bacterium]
MKVRNEVIAGGAALVTLAGVALAGYQYKNRQKGYHREFDVNTVEEISGKVVDITYSGKDNSESKGMELILQTDEKLIPIYLGPVWYMKMQHEKFKKGETISVIGSRMDLNDKSAIVAQELKQGNKLLRLRDENGHPHWIAWERKSFKRHVFL